MSFPAMQKLCAVKELSTSEHLNIFRRKLFWAASMPSYDGYLKQI